MYDVAGASISGLRTAGVMTASCLSNDVAENHYMDAQPDPSLGTGYYYLVRGQTACGIGTYGSNSGGVERQPTAACP